MHLRTKPAVVALALIAAACAPKPEPPPPVDVAAVRKFIEGANVKFIEAEIQAPAEVLDAARAVLLQVVADLGLTQTERRSYLEMLLARK